MYDVVSEVAFSTFGGATSELPHSAMSRTRPRRLSEIVRTFFKSILSIEAGRNVRMRSPGITGDKKGKVRTE